MYRFKRYLLYLIYQTSHVALRICRKIPKHAVDGLNSFHSWTTRGEHHHNIEPFSPCILARQALWQHINLHDTRLPPTSYLPSFLGRAELKFQVGYGPDSSGRDQTFVPIETIRWRLLAPVVLSSFASSNSMKVEGGNMSGWKRTDYCTKNKPEDETRKLLPSVRMVVVC